MIVPVEFLVDLGVFDSKVGAKIDNARTGDEERLGKFGGEAVRQCEKNEAGALRDLFCVGIGKLQRARDFVMSEAGENVGHRFAGKLARRGGDKINIRMAEQQAHQFFAGITGSANDRDLGSCHNAQCVFRLARIATKTYVTNSALRFAPQRD